MKNLDDIQAKIDLITKSDTNKVISQGFAQLYRQQPSFPVTYLAQWLKQYSSAQKRKADLINQKASKKQKYQHSEKEKAEANLKRETEEKQKKQGVQKINQVFKSTIHTNKYLQDLLSEWLPEFIESSYNFTGSYCGKLDYNKKALEEHNFQIGAENDIDNPKVISYIGASKSHQALMLNKTLPLGQGRSYQVFEEAPEQAIEQGTQPTNVAPKKKYLYVENVLKQPKLYYLKYPKLGAYVCYPLKIKSYLTIASLDKGIHDYKTYLKTKQQVEKQYQQKFAQAKTQFQQAQKKFDDFQAIQEDKSTVQQKKVYGTQAALAGQKFKTIQTNVPIVPQTVFDTVQRNFFLGCDTLGQDRQISQTNLSDIAQKVSFFKNQWQHKQRQMLLADILALIQEQTQVQALQNQYHEYEKTNIIPNQTQIKQQFLNRQKEAEFQFSLLKCQKLRQLLNESAFKASMNVYLNYNIPKFTELIQIWCMILGYKKQEINHKKTNTLDHRKMINNKSFSELLQKLQKYPLKRQSSQNVTAEYKINKFIERLQKIDSQSLAKYNGFLFVLFQTLKSYCWTRIFCRDAKKQIFESKKKAKQDRDNQIIKWNQDIQKNLQVAKTELDEQGLQNFVQQNWRKTYQTQNPRPQLLQMPVYLDHQDIQ